MDNTAIGMLLIVALVFTLPYLYTYFSTRRAIGKTVSDFSPLLSDRADTSAALFFYFMTDNCPMCKAMSPLIKELQQSDPNVSFINVNETPDIAKQFYVSGTPTLLVIRENTIIRAKLGGLNKKKLTQFIQSYRIND